MLVSGVVFYTPGPVEARQLHSPPPLVEGKKGDVCMGNIARLTIVLPAIFFVTQLPDTGPS
jgi:hypothetical protein